MMVIRIKMTGVHQFVKLKLIGNVLESDQQVVTQYVKIHIKLLVLKHVTMATLTLTMDALQTVKLNMASFVLEFNPYVPQYVET